MRSTSSWAVTFDPFKLPLRDRETAFERAVEQIVFALSEITSQGENDCSNEVVSVVRSDGDLSWIDVAVTKA